MSFARVDKQFSSSINISFARQICETLAEPKAELIGETQIWKAQPIETSRCLVSYTKPREINRGIQAKE